MQLNNLVILDDEVMAGTLEMGHLHEMAADERHANVDVEVLWRELSRRALQVELVHDARQLLTCVVGRLERPVVDEVVVAPLRVFLVLLEGMVDVEHGEMVPVDVGEPHFGLIGSLLGFGRSNEDLRYRKHGGDGEDLVRAVELGGGDEHLDKLGIEGELGHNGAQVGHIAVVVQGSQVIEELEGAHQRFGRRRVHEVKVRQVVDAQLLQVEHHRAQVGAQDFRVRVVLHLPLKRLLRVQSKALARPRSPGAAGALLRRRFADR